MKHKKKSPHLLAQVRGQGAQGAPQNNTVILARYADRSKWRVKESVRQKSREALQTLLGCILLVAIIAVCMLAADRLAMIADEHVEVGYAYSTQG